MEDYSLDSLLEVLEGKKRFPAIESPIQREQVVEVQDEAMSSKPKLIPRTKEVPSTDLSKFAREAYNEALVPNIADKDMMENLAEKAYEKQQVTEDILKRLMRNQLAKTEGGPSPFKAEDIDIETLLKSYGEEQRSADKPYQGSLSSQLIYALGPAALGLATGDSAGAYAAADTQTLGQKLLERDREAAMTKKTAEKLTGGTKLKAIADLVKAKNEMSKEEAASELNVEKFKQDQFKQAVDIASELYKQGAISKEKFIDRIEKAQNEINQMQQKGIGEILDTEQKALDNVAMEQRAKISAKAVKTKQERPTESEKKFASVASALSQAEEAYQRYLKSVNGVAVSTKDPAYNTYREAIEKGSARNVLSFVLQKFPDGPARRQIQAEIKWIAAKLRGDSGAAINADEYVSEAAQHFPSFKDDPETIAEKDAARMQVLNQAKENAGRAKVVPTVKPREIPKEKEKEKQPDVFDKDAYKYSQMHNIPYERALQILQLRRGK